MRKLVTPPSDPPTPQRADAGLPRWVWECERCAVWVHRTSFSTGPSGWVKRIVPRELVPGAAEAAARALWSWVFPLGRWWFLQMSCLCCRLPLSLTAELGVSPLKGASSSRGHGQLGIEESLFCLLGNKVTWREGGSRIAICALPPVILSSCERWDEWEKRMSEISGL